MPRYIVKIQDYYLEWSTIVDCPVTFGSSLEDFKIYYKEQYGTEGMRDLPNRLERVDQYGTSSHMRLSVSDLINCNRAGPQASELTLDEIYQAYCLCQPIRDGWTVPVVEDWEPE